MNEINYSLIIDKSLHYVVRNVLEIVGQHGLIGNHHFFISFLTHYPGVSLSEKIKLKYPHEITIVLQHQYEDLVITENYFSVVLSFGGVKEQITVPYAALTAFADPSVKFGLQFKHAHLYYNESLELDNFSAKHPSSNMDINLDSKTEDNITASGDKPPKSNVIDFRSFLLRKKKKD